MKHRLKTSILAATLAGTMAAFSLQTPAYAGGSVSFTLNPSHDQGGDLLSTGIRLYFMYRGLKNGEIRQDGSDNAAGIAQGGRDNVGFIRQRGSDHSATLRQNGDENAYGIFQYGHGAHTDVEQNGYGEGGLTFSYGWR